MFSRKRSRPQSSSSRRFRESTHLIPTPGVEQIRPKKYNSWTTNSWVVLSVTAFMVLIGIAIEIALSISKRNNGFAVAQHNVFTFAPVTFLTSFFPTLFVFPLNYTWEIICRAFRWYQPWVALAQGGKTIEESLLLDYHMANVLLTLWRTLRRREWIVFISIITGFGTTLYQPLAGALLNVATATLASPTTLQGSTTLGLIPDVSTLNAFLAAAGFTEAAAFQGLPDPPFVNQGWATAQFTLPSNPGVNASVYWNTTGISTDSGCYAPATVVLNTSSADLFTVTATGADGCSAVANFNPDSASQQYGTAATDPVSCGLPADTPQQFGPVMFWFYTGSGGPGNNTPAAQAVICRPITQLSNIGARVDLNNGSLTNVIILDNFTPSSNMTGTPFNGSVYNAVLFGSIPSDAFVTARAIAIGSQIPGAILRLAQQNATALQQYFAEPNGDGFLNLTHQIYTQHLSVSAKSVYFVNANLDLPATKMSQVERLFMDALAAHALATLLILIGLTGATIHLLHRRQRRALWLVAHPGTIAAIVALTSHSGFGDLLYPYDDRAAIARKLAHLRFSLDRRTGAVVADEYGYMGDSGGEDEDEKGGEDAVVVREREMMRSPHFPVDIPYEHEPLVVPDLEARTPPRSRSPPPRARTPPGMI